MIRHGREPVEVRKHFLGVPHHSFESIRDVVHFGGTGFLGQAQRNVFDDLVTWIRDRIHRMAKANHHFFVFNARADICFSFLWCLVAFLNFERDFVCAAVLRSAQRADAARDGRVHIGACTGDHAAGEG